MNAAAVNSTLTAVGRAPVSPEAAEGIARQVERFGVENCDHGIDYTSSRVEAEFHTACLGYRAAVRELADPQALAARLNGQAEEADCAAETQQRELAYRQTCLDTAIDRGFEEWVIDERRRSVATFQRIVGEFRAEAALFRAEAERVLRAGRRAA